MNKNLILKINIKNQLKKIRNDIPSTTYAAYIRKATGKAPKKSEELGALEDIVKNRRLS